MRQDDTCKEFCPWGDDLDCEFDRAPTEPFFRGEYRAVTEELEKYPAPAAREFRGDLLTIVGDFVREPAMAIEDSPYSSADFRGFAEGTKQMSTLKHQLSFADISDDENWSKQMSKEEC